MNTPLVSVCIPVLNGERHLGSALDSALSQDYPKLEVVAVDNCSSDGTARILGDYAARFPRKLRVHTNAERVPMTANFNIAVEHSRGDYVKVLPHDDVLTPRSVSLLMAARQDDDRFIVGLRSFIFEATPIGRRVFYGNLNRFWRADRHLGTGKIHPETYLRVAARNTTHNAIGEPASALISRSAFDAVGGFDERFHQLCDLKLWHDLALRYGLRIVPEVVAQFRVHDTSQSAIGRTESQADLLKEHLELSRAIAGHSETSRAPADAWNASVNLALDRSRLRHFLASTAGSTREPEHTLEQPLEQLASRVVKHLRLKRIYQLLTLKVLAGARRRGDGPPAAP